MPRFYLRGFPGLQTNKARKHLRARKSVKNGSVLFKVFFRIGVVAKLLASLAQGIQPRGIFRGILLLQFFSQTLCERWAFSVGRDGNLQIAAMHNGAVVEMAVGDVIDGVAEAAAALGALEHRGVHRRNRSRSDYQR